MEVSGDNVSNVDNKNENDDLCPKHEQIISWDGMLVPEMDQTKIKQFLEVTESNNVALELEEDNEVKEEKIPLSHELQQGVRILHELMSDANKHFNWPFMDPVDASIPELSDYYERVKSPMWLKKMEEKFELRQYETITEFVADFRQMLENCFRYNGPDHYVSKRGQRLETMLEQKLALLSRELREKTTIEATSGSSNSSSNRGVRRRGYKSIIPHDSSNLLNQLREEEARKAKELRQNQIAERKAVNDAWLSDLQGWEDELLSDPYRTYMKAMWELPQIGLFLFLCQGPLNLLEVTQFELERCFAMVKQSSTLQWTMTSLLSTPFQRTKIEKKTVMPYSVWNEKLTARLSIWYKALDDAKGDIYVASCKLGIDMYFFDVVGKKNPLLKKKFHELSFYRKVWIMKTLCDHCMEIQESLRDAIEFQPPADQHEYVLGWDSKGNSYLHFPQFCGADVRIYRQAPLPEPDTDEEESIEIKPQCTNKEDYTPPVKKKKKSSGNFGRRKRGSQVKKVKKQEYEGTDQEENSESCSAPPSRSLTATPEVNDPDSDTSSLSSSWSTTRCSKRKSGRTGLARKLLKQFDKNFHENNSTEDDNSLLENTEIDSHDADLSDITVPNDNNQESCKPEKNCEKSEVVHRGVYNKASCKYSQALSCDKNRNSENQSEPNSANSPVYNSENNFVNKNQRTSQGRNSCMKAGGVTTGKSECVKMDCSTDSVLSPDVNGGEFQDCDNNLTSHNLHEFKTNLVSLPKLDTKKSIITSETNVLSETKEKPNNLASRSDGNSLNSVTVMSSTGAHTNNGLQSELCEDKTETAAKSLTNIEPLCSKPVSSNRKEEHIRTNVCDLKPGESCVTEASVVSVNSNGEVLHECLTRPNGDVHNIKQECVSEPGEDMQHEIKKESVTEQSNGDVEHVVKKEGVTEENGDVKQECVTEPDEEEEEEMTPVIGDFELIVENVEQLREICALFAEPDPASVRKGRKIVKPTPRKKCVIELHERLLFLLNELEPWETKLCQATRRARVKMRKEFENYKEEEPDDLKNWNSDNSEEGSSDSGEDESSDVSEVETKEKKTSKKLPQLIQKTPEFSTTEDYEFDVSSRGRLRKRRVIPNNTEDQFCKKKRQMKVSEEPALQTSLPNILSKQQTATPSTGNILTSSALQGTTGYVLSPSLASTGQLLRMSLINPSVGKSVFTPSAIKGQKVQTLANTSVTQTSHPVIQSLLSIRKPTTSMSAGVSFRKIQLKGQNNPVTATVIQTSEAGSAYSSLEGPIHIVAKPATSSQKPLQLSTLPPGVLQQLLKNKAMRIQTAGGATTILLTAPVRQVSPPDQPGFQHQTSETFIVQNESQPLQAQSFQTVASTPLAEQNITATVDVDSEHGQAVTSPTNTFATKVPITNSSGSLSASNSLGMLTSNLPMLSPSKQRYANNITVKELLETRVAHGRFQSEVSTSPGLTQSIFSENVVSESSQNTDPITSVYVQDQSKQSSVSAVVKQSIIDTAIKSVMTSVNTSLPTVNIKIPSPVTLPSINLRKNVTKTIQAMKSPITVTPKLESLVSSASAGPGVATPVSGKTVLSTPTALGSQMSFIVQGAGSAAPGASQKGVILKGTPQTVITSQGVVHGYLTAQGLIIPSNQVQVSSGPKLASAKQATVPVSPQKVNISSSPAVLQTVPTGFVIQSLGHKPDGAAQTMSSSANKKSEMMVSTVSTLTSPLASPAVMQSLSAAIKLKSQSQTNKNVPINSVQMTPQTVSTVRSPDGKQFSLTNVNLVQGQKAGANVQERNLATVLTGLSSKPSPATPAAELMKQIVAGQKGQMANILLGSSPDKKGVVPGDARQLGLKLEKTEQPSMIPAVIVNPHGAMGATQKKIVLPLQNIRPSFFQGAVITSTSSRTSPPQAQNMLNSAVKQLFPTETQPQMSVPGKMVSSPVNASTPCLSTNIKVNKLLLPSVQPIQQVHKPVLLSAQNLQMAQVQQSPLKPDVISKGQVILPQKDGIGQPTRLVLNQQLVAGQLGQVPLAKLAVPQSPVQKVIYNLPQNTVLQQAMTSGQQNPLNVVGVSPSPSLPNANVRFLFPTFSTLPASLNQNLQTVVTGTSSKSQSSSTGIMGVNQSKQGLSEMKPPDAKVNHPTLASALLQTSRQLNTGILPGQLSIHTQVKAESGNTPIQPGIVRNATSPVLAARPGFPVSSTVGIPSLKLPEQPECKQVEGNSLTDALHVGPCENTPVKSHVPTMSDKTENASKSVANIHVPAGSTAPNLPSTGNADSTPTKQQKLMLYNIGGQLMTAQGVPVTVHQGILKVVPQATIQVGSQVLTVRAPSSSLVQTVPPLKKTGVATYPPSGVQQPTPSHQTPSSAPGNYGLPAASVQKLEDSIKEKNQTENLHNLKVDQNLESGQHKMYSFLPESGKSVGSGFAIGTVKDMGNHPQKVMKQALTPCGDVNQTFAFPANQVVAAGQKQNMVPSDSKYFSTVDRNRILYQQSASVVTQVHHESPTLATASSPVHHKMLLANSSGASLQVVPTSRIESLAPNALVTNNVSEAMITNNINQNVDVTMSESNGSVLRLNSQQNSAPNTPTKSREEAALNLLSLAAVVARNSNNQF